MADEKSDSERVSGGREEVVSADMLRERRVPPGQVETKKWPVLHYGAVPKVDLAKWTFKIFGEVEAPWQCDWKTFAGLRQLDVKCDIHCVTRWSRLNNVFTGPGTRTVLGHVKLKAGATHVLVHGEGGFTTNLSLADFLGEDCLFATHHDGVELTAEHGYPARLVVPRLYFWKSAKWVRGVEVLSEDVPGFWEANGYHMHGDPWSEERHSWE